MRAKKILAAVTAFFMAAVVSGCQNTGDEKIMEEVLRDIPNVTETTEMVDFSDLSFEEIPETEPAATSGQSVTKETEITAYYDDSMFPVGEWIDVTDIDETFYSFDEDGRLEIGLQTHSVFGEYTFEDNMLTLILDLGFDAENYMGFAFDVQQEEDGYRLYYNAEKSTGELDLPDMDQVSHTSDQELIAGLSYLVSGFENRGSIFLNTMRYGMLTDINERNILK